MSLTAYQAARDYVEDASRRTILAISPRTLSARLGCSDEDSLALLKKLRSDGIGDFRGYVTCPNCKEAIALKSAALSDIYREASSLVGLTCRYCDEITSANADELEIQLSFFLTAATVRTAAATTDAGSNHTLQSPISLATLKAADRVNVQNIVIVQDGGSLNMQNNNDQEGKAQEQTGRVSTGVDIQGDVAFSKESSTVNRGSATGKETYRRVKRSSGLVGWLIGHTEEERLRHGKYVEKTDTSKRNSFRITVAIAIVIVATAGLWLVFHLLRS